ncbi:VOC family protein [Streptomyces sp. NBC_01465]|uniref:VOC family protein n=1 Tax=Streptomyces sp. NBC_01465 TaxID=2903878 RepID=UPI002E357C30|nr:VOC family protein [Streptomyces sp. NBC_01465]
MPSTLRTGHIGLNVTDIDRSLAFYADVLGFQVIGEGKEGESRYAFLGENGTLVLTLWQQADAAYDRTRAGLHHLAFEVPALDDVRAAEQQLRERGTEFAYDGVVAHREGGASGGIFFHDPDGTRLEIYAPTGAEEAPAPSATAPTCGFF